MPVKASEREGGRNQIGFRVSDTLRQQLETEASKAGRSLSQEVEWRISQSFAQQSLIAEAFGGEASATCAMTFGRMIKEIQRGSGKAFIEDTQSLIAAVIGMSTITKLYADICGDVPDEGYDTLHMRGTAAAYAAVRSTNTLLQSELLEEPAIDTTWVDPTLTDPAKAHGALKRRKRPFALKRAKKPA